MAAADFFDLFRVNIWLFLSAMTITSATLYLSIRKCVVAGILDPLHFYWTFTIGTAYGISIGLYYLNQISTNIFVYQILSALTFVFFYRLFIKNPIKQHKALFFGLLVVKHNPHAFIATLTLLYFLIAALIIYVGGLGLFADVNRFEQNRGHGALVRIADLLRIFLIAAVTINLIRTHSKTRFSLRFLLHTIFLLLLITFSAALNGAKFAFLEGIYASIISFVIFSRRKPKFSPPQMAGIALLPIAFAIAALTINLAKNDVTENNTSRQFSELPFVIERLFLRVLGNGDKYYLGLPNDVIENIETDNIFVRFASPLVGSTRLSQMLGYDVGHLNVGKQILLHHNPDYLYAGGPTSHFDLFSYKYFGYQFGWIWIIFTSLLLASIASLSRHCCGNIYASALVATLWLRTLPILLEPPIGFAYLIDIIIVFSSIKIASIVIAPSRKAYHGNS